MKKIIRLTESDLTNIVKTVIKENSLRDDLIQQIKEYGWKETSEFVGGGVNLKKLIGFDNPMDFLHLFDDLNVVQSEEEPNVTLYRYKKGHNLMYHDRKNGFIYISYEDIWSVFEDDFRLMYSDIQEPIMVWLDEVYDLRGLEPPQLFSFYGYGNWIGNTM
jgi:hypothetical protein